MIRSLLWKEWREHRWKMGGILAVYFFIILAAGALLKRDALLTAQDCLTFFALLIPGFVAIGTVTDERAARTLDSLRVLPVPLPRLFFYKWLFRFATVVLPLALAELLCYGFLPKSHYGSQGLVSFINGVMTVASAASIYTWTVALGIRFTKEHGVALIAIAVITLGLLTGVELNPFFRAGAIEYIWCIIMPVGVLTKSGHDEVPGVTFILIPVLHLPVMAALYYWSSRRFGLNRSIRRPLAIRSAVFPAIQKLRGRRNPILWKTWKETSWIWAWYLGISFVLMVAAGIYFQYESLYERFFTFELLRRIANATSTVAGIVSYGGLFLAIATGAEIGMGDFERGVDRFWRSRPIESKAYFRRRFFSGWFLAMSALTLPMLLNFWSSRAQLASFNYLHHEQYGYIVALNGQSSRMASMFLWLVVPIFSATYALAAMFGAFIRGRVMAMVVTVSGLVGAVAIGSEVVMRISTALGEHAEGIFWPVISVGGGLFLTTLFGWLAQLAFQGDWKERIAAFIHSRAAANPKANQT